MRLLLLFIFCILVFGSCTSNTNKTEEIVEGEVFNIPIDATISPRTNTLKSINFGDGDLLYYLNDPKYEIIVFDLESKRIKHRIRLKKEGPNAIDAILGFSILSKNEIIVADRYPKLHLVNLQGQTVKRINYIINEGEVDFSRMAIINSSTNNDVYKVGSYLIIPQQPIFRSREGVMLGHNERLESKLFLKVKEDGTDGQFLDIALPKNFFTGKPPNQYAGFSSLYVKGQLLWSFNTDMNIYFTKDLINVTKKEIDVGKKSQNLSFDPMSLGPFETLTRLDSYKSILYDLYRKKYYSMVRYGVVGDARKGLPPEHLAYYPNKFSIFIFDEDLNFEKEVEFSGTKYHFNQFFISSKGFYLSLANPLNPDFDENFLQFEKVEL